MHNHDSLAACIPGQPPLSTQVPDLHSGGSPALERLSSCGPCSSPWACLLSWSPAWMCGCHCPICFPTAVQADMPCECTCCGLAWAVPAGPWFCQRERPQSRGPAWVRGRQCLIGFPSAMQADSHTMYVQLTWPLVLLLGVLSELRPSPVAAIAPCAYHYNAGEGLCTASATAMAYSGPRLEVASARRNGSVLGTSIRLGEENAAGMKQLHLSAVCRVIYG